MTNDKAFHIEKLAIEFERRRRRNPAYSLRAFARSLEMQAPTLSHVIRGQRSLAKKQAKRVASLLRLSPLEEEHFVKSTHFWRDKSSGAKLPLTDKAKVLHEEHFYRVIAEWEHYAILTLMDTEGFKHNPQWIAQRLGLSQRCAEGCLRNLTEVGLIRKVGRRFVKCQAHVKTPEGVSSQALRHAHLENLELARIKLESTPVNKRNFSSVTLPVDLKHLPELRKIIYRFQEELLEFSSKTKGQQVYQMALQFYPLTILNAQDSQNIGD